MYESGRRSFFTWKRIKSNQFFTVMENYLVLDTVFLHDKLTMCMQTFVIM